MRLLVYRHKGHRKVGLIKRSRDIVHLAIFSDIIKFSGDLRHILKFFIRRKFSNNFRSDFALEEQSPIINQNSLNVPYIYALCKGNVSQSLLVLNFLAS